VVAESTLDDVRTSSDNTAGVWGRRAALLAMLVVVLVGATGWLGVHARTTHATGGGYDLTVTYPRVARSGLDIPWEVRVVHPGGFSDKITLALSADYFDIIEFQGMHPEPSAETSDGEFVYLTFDPPPSGDVFAASLDTYIQPASQVGRNATVRVIVDGQPVTEVNYSTWLVP
jgi:hypothetical protein